MKLHVYARGADVCAESSTGATLASAIRAVGIPLNVACGGRGLCGRCVVVLCEGSFVRGDERVELAEGRRMEVLACEWHAVSDHARVEVPDTSLIEEKAQVHADFVLADFTPTGVTRLLSVRLAPAETATALAERVTESVRAGLHLGNQTPVHVPLSVLRQVGELSVGMPLEVSLAVGPDDRGWCVIRAEAEPAAFRHLGVAMDIGTTTVVCALVDMDTGDVLGRVSGYNQQIRRADDVASRISACRDGADLAEFRTLIVEATLNPLIEELCRAVQQPPAAVARMAVAGNTVMMHLLLGLSPAGIGVLPFEPVARRFPLLRAPEIGLVGGPETLVDIAPCVAGYIGGDVVADLLACRMLERKPPTMLVDVGTNGEIVLWDGERLTAAATAAGPAFEGAGVRHGCRAAAGAMDHLSWNGTSGFDFTVIGGGAPVGLCGSAMVDFMAESVRCGLLGPTGRFDVDRLARWGLGRELETPRGCERACMVADEEHSGLAGPLLVTERDVAEILKAKAAIFAGMQTVLETRGLRFEDVEELVLAGGFAHHIDLRHAVRIGLLPAVPSDRVHVLGNGSLAGAYLSLLKPGAGAERERLASRIVTIELNRVPSFADHYVDALLLDDTDGAQPGRGDG